VGGSIWNPIVGGSKENATVEGRTGNDLQIKAFSKKMNIAPIDKR
jgi:hypothetical protein